MYLQEEIQTQHNFSEIVGNSPALLTALALLLLPMSGVGQQPTDAEAAKERGAAPAGAPGGAPAAQPEGDAERGAAASHSLAAPRATAVRATGLIRIDGRPDEESWASAPPLTDFTQYEPREGEPMTQRSDVRFVYDDDALYVGAMLYGSDYPILTRLAKHDVAITDTDFFALYIDGYHDHRTAYRFGLNPSGMRRDILVNPDGSLGDVSWNPIWESATEITDEGWSFEMRIPFSQLRFSPEDVQVWGLQVERKIRYLEEEGLFAFTPLLQRGGVARYGHLDGIRGIASGRKLELLPYVAGSAEFVQVAGNPQIDFENPFQTGEAYRGRAGLDLKYRAGTNVTIDATVNPDFGQVEADPAVINLTAFETRYQERRPFFVEGGELFSFQEGGTGGATGSPPELVYSRRIGRAPQGDVPSQAAFAEDPGATTILGAAKLTGRTDSGWSLGLLQAVTQRETVPWVDEARARSKTVVEPTTSYLAGRLRRDFRAGATRLGVLGTTVNRALGGDPLAEDLSSAAYTGGVDFTNEWANRSWRFSAALAGSRVQGSEAAITSVQRSSSRYFQRPDAEHLGVDTGARALSGYYAMLDFEKQAGRFQPKVAAAAISPGFEVNDLGFHSRTDRLIVDTNLRYQETVPGKVFRNWSVSAGPDAAWNYDGARVFGELNVQGNWILANYWQGNSRFSYRPATDDDRLTRGGPMARSPARFAGGVSQSNRRGRAYVVQVSWDGAWDDAGSWQSTAGLDVTLRWNNWEVLLGPQLAREHAAAQYVSAATDPLAQATYGRRYVFADLDQTTLSMDARVNVTFTPRLTFELYAQPFISSGNYGALKEFRSPGTFQFLRYGTDVGTVEELGDGRYRVDPDGAGPASSFSVANRDFNLRSLLGNAVLRWEWRPGSTLYLVWQQTRSHEATVADPGSSSRVGEFDFADDAGDLFRIRPDNVFQVKVSYWLNP